MENRTVILIVGIIIGYILHMLIPVWFVAIVLVAAAGAWLLFVRGRTTT